MNPNTSSDRLAQILEFLRHAEQLKNTLRSAHTSTGRQESTAEHTWRLCLMVMLFASDYPELDILRLMKLCVIHDLGEAVNGDIPAPEQQSGSNKSEAEKADFVALISPLPTELRAELLTLWEDYENASSPEAKLAKAFDKLETMLQHTQGQNPADFDYAFNLRYGKQYTQLNQQTKALRELIDHDTQQRLLAAKNNT